MRPRHARRLTNVDAFRRLRGVGVWLLLEVRSLVGSTARTRFRVGSSLLCSAARMLRRRRAVSPRRPPEQGAAAAARKWVPREAAVERRERARRPGQARSRGPIAEATRARAWSRSLARRIAAAAEAAHRWAAAAPTTVEAAAARAARVSAG